MDKEFAEVFQEEIVVEGKIEELGKQIAGLAHKFKEGKDDVMTMADEMITNGSMPDPEMIKMLETEEADMVIHLIAKKMGVQWTKDNGYGEMRFKQNYPEEVEIESQVKKLADRFKSMVRKEEIELTEMKWEAGVVYHQEFKNGDKVYFRADSVQKNKRWKGLSVDEFGGRQKKAKNASADEKSQGWVTTPKNEIPKELKEEVEIDEKKSATGYELYHKDFSSAMQHAYAFAKSKGHVVDPKEIDDKVATGPKKPSSGKTNRYSLKAGRKTVEIQVANLDNKRYELNMYIEEVEVDARKKA